MLDAGVGASFGATAGGVVTSASIGAVQGVLQGIQVDEATIRSIVKILESSIEGLEQPLERVPGAAFGASWWGSQLAHHTDIAHDHVAQAMLDMLAGVVGYQQSLETYVQETVRVDEESEVASTRLLSELDAATLCTSQPNVQTNTSCELPTPSGEDV